MAPTLEKVAKLAGVSRSTVSRVINDHPNVRSETRELVWRAIRESGYQPHAVARSLVTNRTQIIGMIIPETVPKLFTDPFFPLLLRGATEACNAHHYQLLLSLFDNPAGREEMYQRVLRNGYVDGVIVASASLDDPLIPALLRDDIPFVSVGRYPNEKVHYVDVDNIGGAQMAVEHLIRLGHQRIATITGPLDMAHGQDRLEGYRQALKAHRIPVEEELIVEGDYTENGGMIAMQRLLSASPDAVFVASDMMAIGALKAIRQADRQVPQDIALVSFDDVPIASAIEPALTTVRQPIESMGSMAIEVLLSILEGSSQQEAPVHRIILPTELIIRASCGSTLSRSNGRR
ncbi:MAG: LacI family DNA-binding transcriptional regulator [Anaerolineae bacterium]|jgi:LacI family transcriptional regulator|nr:LacI family DNA-binding transcriptional regulator [Anaerolineae bacterium]